MAGEHVPCRLENLAGLHAEIGDIPQDDHGVGVGVAQRLGLGVAPAGVRKGTSDGRAPTPRLTSSPSFR